MYGGNYPETVVNALLARGNWAEGKEGECIEKCNFIWRPVNFNPESQKRLDQRLSIKRGSLGPLIYNHFEVLKGLTTKTGLVRSLKQYYKGNDLSRKDLWS